MLKSHPLLSVKEQTDLLQALLCFGPRFKAHIAAPLRDAFLHVGWITEVVIAGESGWFLATPAGRTAYLDRFQAQDFIQAETNRISEILFSRVMNPQYSALPPRSKVL
jgi:hypothetical protein